MRSVILAANYLDNWKNIAILKGDTSQQADDAISHAQITSGQTETPSASSLIGSRYTMTPVAGKHQVPWH